MKIDSVDLQKLLSHKDSLRDQLTARLDSITDTSVEHLTGNGKTNLDAAAVVDAIRSLANDPLLAKILVHSEVVDHCRTALKSPPAPTMEEVIEKLVESNDMLLESRSFFESTDPEFFPLLVEAYGVALRTLRLIDAAGTLTQDICQEIDDGQFPWRDAPAEHESAYQRFRQEDPGIVKRATEIALKRGIKSGKPVTATVLADIHKIAARYNIDVSTLGLGESGGGPSNDARFFEAQDSLRQMGINVDPSRIKVIGDGVYLLMTDDHALNEAELDGGPDNLPRLDDADGVDRSAFLRHANCNGDPMDAYAVNHHERGGPRRVA